ncbi:MAG: LysM peptidoglycan-binding domain-containing protein [Spirochaetaceae bacterium]|jgi:nucleoid-associated protein YgaU|nr:LysM peptidoglycan-binding domain-containing protein [Spirochaetaceae bacterium]
MKRRTPLIFLLLFSILFVISCASGQETVQNPEPVRVSEPAKAPEPPKAEPAAPNPAPVVKNDAPPAAPPKDPRPSALIFDGAQRHRVVWGDTLSSLAKKYYGPRNGYYFPIIMLASAGVVSNPDVIIPGTILTIPDLNKNLADPQARSKIKSYLKDTAQLYERKRDTKTRNQLIQLSNSL